MCRRSLARGLHAPRQAFQARSRRCALGGVEVGRTPAIRALGHPIRVARAGSRDIRVGLRLGHRGAVRRRAPLYSALPCVPDGRAVDWVPIPWDQALRQRNMSGVSHALAEVGHCLHGVALPAPESHHMSVPTAWRQLHEACIRLDLAMYSLASHWIAPAVERPGHHSRVASEGRDALQGHAPLAGR